MEQNPDSRNKPQHIQSNMSLIHREKWWSPETRGKREMLVKGYKPLVIR